MDVPFRGQFDHRRWVFTLQLEPQSFAAFTSDVPRLNVQGTLRYGEREQNNDLAPVLLELHGRLTRANGLADVGALLLPVKELPLNLFAPYGFPLVNLSFLFSKDYIQFLEEERSAAAARNVSLTLHMWGLAAMVRQTVGQVPTFAQDRQFPGEVVRFERIETDPSGQLITLERSAWVDRLLPGLGYRRGVLVELPLLRTPPMPEAYRGAVEALDQAQRAFGQEDYRGAVRYGREVLEHLGQSSSDGSRQLSSFCKEYLEPIIGETKAQAIDSSLGSVRRMTNASSHVNGFHADRATAAFVLETLTLNLRYIAAILG
jgi:hypothetical protein